MCFTQVYKETSQRQGLGYRDRGCRSIILNLVDVENPAYNAKEIFGGSGSIPIVRFKRCHHAAFISNKEQLRISELAKTKFGQAHFDEIGVNYSWVMSAGEV